MLPGELKCFQADEMVRVCLDFQGSRKDVDFGNQI